MRRFIVTASYTQEMDVIVYVPNKWDSSDIMQHYKEKGACGEFNEDPEDCLQPVTQPLANPSQNSDANAADQISVNSNIKATFFI